MITRESKKAEKFFYNRMLNSLLAPNRPTIPVDQGVVYRNKITEVGEIFKNLYNIIVNQDMSKDLKRDGFVTGMNKLRNYYLTEIANDLMVKSEFLSMLQQFEDSIKTLPDYNIVKDISDLSSNTNLERNKLEFKSKQELANAMQNNLLKNISNTLEKQNNNNIIRFNDSDFHSFDSETSSSKTSSQSSNKSQKPKKESEYVREQSDYFDDLDTVPHKKEENVKRESNYLDYNDNDEVERKRESAIWGDDDDEDYYNDYYHEAYVPPKIEPKKETKKEEVKKEEAKKEEVKEEEKKETINKNEEPKKRTSKRRK